VDALGEDFRAAVGIDRLYEGVLVLGGLGWTIDHHGAGEEQIARADIARKLANIGRAVDVGPVVFPILVARCRVDGGEIEDIE